MSFCPRLIDWSQKQNPKSIKDLVPDPKFLPATKADAVDMEDDIAGVQSRLHVDLNQFTDTLTRSLQRKIYDIDLEEGQTGDPHLMSLARYAAKEKEVASTFFKDQKSGLSKIYEAVENEVKAEMASEMLLMTTDPNYISDPSEARAALIKPAQRNKFRYAALIQQEKNKQLKLKYALKIKRKHQAIDVAKKIALLRASVFRTSAARHELEHLLKKADESVALEETETGDGGEGETCPLPDGTEGHKENGICVP